MSKYIGRLVNVGLGRETSRGTPVAATWWLPKANVTFFDRANRVLSHGNYGVIGDSQQAPKAMEWAEGSIEGDLFDKATGFLLYALFGTLNTTGPVSAAYTHTFSVANTNQHTSLTLTLGDPDRGDRYPLAMIDKMEITVVPDELVTYAADFMARSGRPIGVPTADYTAENKFLGRHVQVKIANLTSGLAAASALSIKSLKLVVAKNVRQNNVLSTVWPDDIINTKMEITGTLELDLEDQTYRQYMLDASYKAMRIVITNTDVTIPGGSTNPSFTLDLSRVMFEEWEAVRPNDEIVMQKINFRALYDVINGNIVNSCVLVNGKSAY